MLIIEFKYSMIDFISHNNMRLYYYSHIICNILSRTCFVKCLFHLQSRFLTEIFVKISRLKFTLFISILQEKNVLCAFSNLVTMLKNQNGICIKSS